MLVTCLAENTAQSPLLQTEHGLSVLIRTKSRTVLFDFGQSGCFAENAKRLGIDLRTVDFAVLSHGHYDHGGGIAKFLSICPSAPVYARKGAFDGHFNANLLPIGVCQPTAQHSSVCILNGDLALNDGFSIVSYPNERQIRGKYFKLLKNTPVWDTFEHEQYLQITENGKTVLFSGCSHISAELLIEHFRPDVFVGGLHLFRHPIDSDLTQIANRLQKSGTKIITCHCTGVAQFEHLKKSVPSITYLSCGDTVEI